MRPGDKCTKKGCGGVMGVYSTRINFPRNVRIRYLRCRSCAFVPEENKSIVPLEYAPSQKVAQ